MDLSLNPITIGLRGTGRQLLGIPTPSLDLDFINSSTLDSRITFTRASGATYFDSSGVLQTAGNNVARFDHNPTTLESLGLLIEEQRTNSIRNNTMQGAVAGTPGTLPTNWLVNNTGGLTTNVIGTGTSNGINYVDLQITGTSTATVYVLSFDANTQISASSGQAWTGSFWISQAAGTLTGINTVNVRVFARDSGGSSLAVTDSSAITLSSTLARYSSVYSSLPASTAYVQSALRLSLTNNTAIDITLRIGLPQLELGAFATSVIPTTTAAATRNADAASMTGTNFSSWYSSTQGALYGEYSAVASGIRTICAINDGTANESIRLRTDGTNPLFTVTDDGADQANIDAGTVASNTFYKFTGAYAVNDFAASISGNSAVTDTSGTLPTVTQLLIGNSSSSNYLNGTIRKIAFYPTRLSNAQLQALTR
jgi:hypothetical protein